MIDKDTIRHRHWSLKISRINPETGQAADTYGQIVTAIDDLHQSIANIIKTPKRSVPTEPEKGCDIEGAIDKHPSIGIPLLTREIWDALRIWEPRIELQKVEVEMVQFSHFSTHIFWRPAEGVIADQYVTQVQYHG